MAEVYRSAGFSDATGQAVPLVDPCRSEAARRLLDVDASVFRSGGQAEQGNWAQIQVLGKADNTFDRICAGPPNPLFTNTLAIQRRGTKRPGPL